MAVALTGLSERDAKNEGYEVEVCHNIKPNKPEYMGGQEMVIKGIADRKTGRLLGVQIVGYEGVDKRIDVSLQPLLIKQRLKTCSIWIWHMHPRFPQQKIRLCIQE